MITKDDSGRAREGWIGLLILIVGIAIGAVAKPRAWFQTEAPNTEPTSSTVLVPPMAPAESIATPPSNNLPTLFVDLEPEHAATLQRVRDRAMDHGMILQEPDDLVPASIRMGDHTFGAKVRIKGDFLDHLDTDKWSLRIELENTKLMGMSRFSIQHPKTRGYLWEWLIMAFARRDGQLAPRSTFVNVVVNNNPTGIYYLEEHFSKELLESQGRREGPIVRFVEDTYWAEYLQHIHRKDASKAPAMIQPSQFVTAAEISAFGEKQLAQTETLARQLQHALNQMRDLKSMILSQDQIPSSSLAKLQAQVDTQGQTIDRIIDIDSTSSMHALMALFRCNHAMVWPNRRFYHNPLTDRLEPVVFDTLAGQPIQARDPIAMTTWTVREFLKSTAYYNRLFQNLGEMISGGFLEDTLDELGPEFEHFAGLLHAEGFIESQTDVAQIKNQLRDQQIFLRELLKPIDGVNFDSRLMSAEPASEQPPGTLVVEAWATTKVPVVLEGFRFSNDRFVRARDALAPDAMGTSMIPGRDGVVLPHDGRRATFRFPIDVRLATLRDVAQIKQAVRQKSQRDKSVRLRLAAEYRYVSDDQSHSEQLPIRRFGEAWSDEGSRPEPASLDQTLSSHSFLAYDPKLDRLTIEPGTWDVAGDLIVPSGHPLHVGPGVTLRFNRRAAIVSTQPLQFHGTAARPIVLEPQPGEDSWQGVTVLEANGKSSWQHVHVRSTDVAMRGGWIMTGGITFYRSPVDLVDCRFSDSRGEDAVNIYGAEFLMERVAFEGIASDAFDGDFVTGTVRDSVFTDSGGDAVDVSGSQIVVKGSRFVGIGDKGISAGEDSTVRVLDSVVESASIGVASKDFSRVDIDGLEIRQATHYGLAVYIKKPEYGPSRISAANMSFGDCGLGSHLVQTTCELTYDGHPVDTADVDVKELYRQKILGN